VRTLTLKHVPASSTGVPPVNGWVPGMRNVPLDVRMAGLKAQLGALGLIAAHPRQVRTGLLSGPWNGFPRHALVIWAGPEHGEEWMAVSDEPALAPD
jgi:hypothetical protein